MFTKITHNNNGDTRVAYVNVEEIVSLGERHQEPTPLYDECGNLVETRQPTEKKFVVVLKNGFKYNIDQTEFDRLVKELVK